MIEEVSMETQSSGTFQETIDNSDLLIDCAGGCKKRILYFAPQVDNWGEAINSRMCLECVTRSIVSGS